MASFLYAVADAKIVFSAIFILDRLLPNVDWAYFMADPRVCISPVRQGCHWSFSNNHFRVKKKISFISALVIYLALKRGN